MNYSILVNTSDGYEDAWNFFFFLLKKNWTGAIPKVFVNTETKRVVSSEIEVKTLNAYEKNESWGKRLVDCVERIDSDYILMMLEDFYYESPINVDKITKAEKILDENPNVMSVQLVPAGECNNLSNVTHKKVINGFVERKKFGLYRIIAGPTLWRKKEILRFTSEKDSPWEWEFFGSQRTWLSGKKIYCWPDQQNPIFNYDIVHGGAIHRGAWVGYKMQELCAKYDYRLDYGKRKVVNNWIKEEGVNGKVLPKNKRINSIIHNRCKSVESILSGLLKRSIN